LKKLIAALAGLAVFAPSALAASHFIKVSPGKVAPGKTITISGSVGNGCGVGHKGDSATLFSKGFKGATKSNFAGIPSISVSLAKSKNGSFSKKLTLSKKVKKGTYTVSGRCGGGNFGSAKFKVAKSNTIGGGGGGFY
jgi:hypothetical protein